MNETMDNDNLTKLSGNKKKARGGKIIPALCNIAGTLILLAVIGLTLIVVLPRAFGMEAYNITSQSMTPEIPVGSIVYVYRIASEDIPSIQADEVIAYTGGTEGVIVHRVVSNHVVEGELITKGDYNEGNDILPVPYSNVIGRVWKHFPLLGDLMTVYTSTAGKINLFIFALSGALLNILAGRLRN